MITDLETNLLYLADTLPIKYPKFYHRLEKILIDSNISFEILQGTKDVWAVDYMPIQKSKDIYIQFSYRPSYLIKYKKYLNTITDVDKICDSIGLDAIKSDIILDGGNVISWTNKVIMTDRIFVENPNYKRNDLIDELYELLGVDDIIFIPEMPNDFTGHADGMLRFIDENLVLINDFNKEKSQFKRSFEIALHNAGLESIKLPYNVYNNKHIDQANGVYINYLQMSNTIILPVFGFKDDNDVVDIINKVFPDFNIITIDSNEIANDGGVLNCISWNIYKQ